ncbi:MAG: phenylacetate--CoA ligase [Deltaproteobacteria bacterium]|jgi:phenylacetate-CoA ligase|nr:phenylacetate--CoA ligase [Deltaproteobacteria bacterium]
MIFEHQFETMTRTELEKLQVDRLKSVLKLAYDRAPFYAKRFREIGFEPQDFKGLDDLIKLPLTEKEDINRHFPEGFLACPPSQLSRFHASSGTTGQLTVMGYTCGDIQNWARLMARCFSAAGVTSADVVNVAYNYGLFTGGLGAHYGAELLGAAILPCSGGASHRQVELMRRLSVSVMCCTPSYALYLAEVAKDDGFDFRDKDTFPLRVGLFGAEPWSDNLKKIIEERLAIKALNLYGLSEVMGPGLSVECLEGQNGLHFFEDHFLAEIIDPQTGATLGPGQLGELVVTTLTREAVPLIRYRTRDITSIFFDPCPCGRTHLRMTRVMGRSDEMLVVRGVNIFPSQFEDLILSEKTLSPNYQITIDRENELDTLEVSVEPNPDNFFPLDEEKLSETLGVKIKEHFGITARLRLLPPKTIVRGQSKTQRVFDRLRGKI